jgi:hypothetical protein
MPEALQWIIYAFIYASLSICVIDRSGYLLTHSTYVLSLEHYWHIFGPTCLNQAGAPGASWLLNILYLDQGNLFFVEDFYKTIPTLSASGPQASCSLAWNQACGSLDPIPAPVIRIWVGNVFIWKRISAVPKLSHKQHSHATVNLGGLFLRRLTICLLLRYR